MKNVVVFMMLGSAVSAFARGGDYAITRDSISSSCHFSGRGKSDFKAVGHRFTSPVNGFSIPGIPKGASVDIINVINSGKRAVNALRDLATDRPDATESPITVDKGHWQIETSVVDYAKNYNFQAWTWAETNLKYGITESMDLQFIFAPYIEENNDGEITDGASDVIVRLKWNLWGNDGGKTAFALFPYIKAPTGTDLSNDKWEGGIILPFSYEINDDWGFGCQLEFEHFYDDENDDYDTDLLHTAVVGYSLTEKWGVYAEYLGIFGHEYRANASGGLTYAVTDMFQLDVGAVVGLNDAADDFNTFTGLTYKF